MSSDEIRKAFFDFFEKKGHVRIEPSALVLEDDPTTLFTSSGMQQLIPFLKGQEHPSGKRLVNSQPSLRLQDIPEVGDNRHTTFFEMLGNWSLGDYFKDEQIKWSWDFFTKELSLDADRLHVSIFGGGEGVEKDSETFEIWKKIGINKKRIHFYGFDKNWWSRSGTPDGMPAGEIGGPDSEVFYEFDIPHDSKYGEKCHPNCDCGKFLEIGNSVFIQYKKESDGSLSQLSQKNVDFGGGLERIAAAVDNEPDIFKSDLFGGIISSLEEKYKVAYGKDESIDRSLRIIADHLRASSAIISNGIFPQNKAHGYVLRKLIRRCVLHALFLGAKDPSDFVRVDFSGSLIPLKFKSMDEINEVVKNEAEKFSSSLQKAIAQLDKIIESKRKISGEVAFDLYQNQGLPLEITLDILRKKGVEFDDAEKKVFEKKFENHRELSRKLSGQMFKGGLADTSDKVVRLHTTTHILHESLRRVLGKQVAQKGSNITSERLRFDFSHPEKLMDEEVAEIEKMVNEKIKEDLPVNADEMTYKEAIKSGALAFFGEKYPERVKVYTIGGPTPKEHFSAEVCGGPHVSHTGEIGRVRIIKHEKVGAGVVRVYADVD